jgi:hypothetical protein
MLAHERKPSTLLQQPGQMGPLRLKNRLRRKHDSLLAVVSSEVPSSILNVALHSSDATGRPILDPRPASPITYAYHR